MTELALVIPTYNESENVKPLLAVLERALEGISYEVIFVDDDSPDGTAALARMVGRTNPRVRVIQRINRRGLASACVEGMMATSAPFIAVMDADLQHDETILPAMLAKLRDEDLDIVVASRNISGGSMGEFAKERVAISGLGRKISRMVCRCEVSDPMSGFFIVNRRFLEEVIYRVSAIGFKILVDLLASCQRPVRLGEVAYRFRVRTRGESKLDALVLVEYLQLVIDKLIGGVIPARFIIFGAVGLIGTALYAAVVFLLFRLLNFPFVTALAGGTLAAMTCNFLLNNSITYRDCRLKGWAMLGGFLSFCFICTFGAAITITIADLARRAGLPWYLAAIFAAVVSSVWNFGVTQAITWRVYKRRSHARAMRAAAVLVEESHG
ncbi:MAG TPA: glycosyltransferase family 2 protein [Bryobacteraceae bacterium]|nr:glycosyltransferase family 2 protein [Bryobacteraceae bacterium]